MKKGKAGRSDWRDQARREEATGATRQVAFFLLFFLFFKKQRTVWTTNGGVEYKQYGTLSEHKGKVGGRIGGTKSSRWERY